MNVLFRNISVPNADNLPIYNAFSCGKIAELFNIFLHKGKLFCAGTMTGVIFGSKSIEEICIAFKRIIKRQL